MNILILKRMTRGMTTIVRQGLSNDKEDHVFILCVFPVILYDLVVTISSLQSRVYILLAYLYFFRQWIGIFWRADRDLSASGSRSFEECIGIFRRVHWDLSKSGSESLSTEIDGLLHGIVSPITEEL